MSQHDYTIDNQSFPAFRTDLNNALSAINTSNSGTSRPSAAVEGTIWLDTSGAATAQLLKMYDGADDILLGTINFTANTIDWADSASEVSLAGVETLTNKTLTSPKINEDVVVTSTATELNKLDGVTSTTAELNILDGVTSTATELNKLDALSRGSILYGNASAATTILTKGTADQVLTSDGTDIAWQDAASGGLDWQSSVVTASTITVVAGRGYWINTTSNACTITLPSSASVGDELIFVDYARKWGTNAVTINPNSLNFQGYTSPNPVYNTDGQSVDLIYSGATQGWIPTVDDDVTLETPQPYSADMLIVAGGGAGGSDAHGGAGGAGGYRTSTQNIFQGTTYTITIGAGGTGVVNTGGSAMSGSDSSISGSGITTITSAGGGGGSKGHTTVAAAGGSGGGGAGSESSTNIAGAGNTPSTSPSQGNNGGNSNHASPHFATGGGGGASAVGQVGQSSTGGNGGAGTANSITGSAVTYAGGGGGSCYSDGGGAAGSGGSGGGGAGGSAGATPVAGTVNLGGGGGGASGDSQKAGGNGGTGVVILSVPTANYSSTTSGSPTVTTSGSNTIIKFTGSGSYTA